MAIFLFRRPNTGYRVQGWVADDGSVIPFPTAFNSLTKTQ